MKIELTSQKVRIKSIKKKTQAQVFKEFEAGDVLEFSLLLRNTSNSYRGGNYATDVTTVNVTKGLVVTKSQSELLNVINRAFELEEVETDA